MSKEEIVNPVADHNVFSMGSGKPTDRVFLTIHIEDCPLVCLSDSGADISLISQSAFNKINASCNLSLTVDSAQSVWFKTLGPGTPLKSLGAVCLDVCIDNFIANNFKFHVVEDTVTSHDVILGVDFMSRHYLAPSPAHRRLIYWPAEVQSPVFVGTPVSFQKPVTLDSPVVLKPFSVCYVKVPKPDIYGHEAVFEPEVGLLEKEIAFSRCLIDLDPDYITVEALCLSPVKVKLKKGLNIGTLSSAEAQVLSGKDSELMDPSSIFDLFDVNSMKLSQDERAMVMEMLVRNQEVIGRSKEDVGHVESGSHSIRLIDPLHEPIKIPPRRLQGKARDYVQSEVDRLCSEGIIEPSDGPWSAPVVPICKPDGSVRLCIDYRALNKITVKDAYPIPNLEDTIYNLSDMRYFSSLDLMRGYYQVPMSPDSKDLTSFVTSSGQWRFLRMPFGLCNAPATFQRLMNALLSRFPVDRVMVYLDDILVIGKTFREHLEILDRVLACLKEHGLKINPHKCQLFKDSVKFLGHLVSANGLSPLPENIEAIVNFKPPRSIKSVQRFLGMINFYRRFIPDCSVIARPLSSLLSSKRLLWTDECQKSFDTLKSLLVTPPVLSFPNFESPEPLCLYTDASQFGAGAYLAQKQDDQERVIAYLSTTFNKAEIRYSVLDKELAAIRWAIKRLKPFLWGRHFIIYSDHKPLSYLQGMRLLDGRLARTLEELGDYDFEIRYIPGHLNVVADALSRDSLSIPVDLGLPSHCLLDNMHEFRVQSGGDTLFRCFSLYWLGCEEEHSFVRTIVIDELLHNPQRYKLTLTKSVKKQLRIMKLPGTLPYFEAIQAFSNLVQASVLVYEEFFGLVKYVPEKVGDRNPCYLRSYDGVCFSFLLPFDAKFEMSHVIPESEPSACEVGEVKVLYPLAAPRLPSDSFVPSSILFEDSFTPEVIPFCIRETASHLQSSSRPSKQEQPSRDRRRKVTISEENPEIKYYDPCLPVTLTGQENNFQHGSGLLDTKSPVSWREIFSIPTIKEWQSKNRPLRDLRYCILNKQQSMKGDKFKCNHRDHHKKYKSHYSSIHCDSSGVLVKELNLESLNEPVFPYLVPFIAACDFVRLAHESNAHVGRDKLYHLVQPYVFHPSLRYIVSDVTRACDHCLRAKPYSVKPSPPVLRIQSNRPFEKVHVDVLQLPHSRFGYKYVLNAVDQYSKWLASQPLKDKTSKSVGCAFAKILSGFPSLPETVVSDNGGEFTGEPFKEVLDRYNVRHIFITPYSPQSNGLVERINRTLLGVLTGLCAPNDWCVNLGRAIITYNNTYHKELKCTPSECLTGLVSKLPVCPEKKPFWKDGSNKFKPYALNSLVGYKNTTRTGVKKKLSPRFSGPYKVVKSDFNQKTYVIELKRDPARQVRAHHSQLRPWFKAPAYLQQSSMFLPDSRDLDSCAPHASELPELVPGLRNLDFPCGSSRKRPDENICVVPIPEVIPGLVNLSVCPNFMFESPVDPLESPTSVPDPCSRGLESPSLHSGPAPSNSNFPSLPPVSPVRNTSTPILSRVHNAPIPSPLYHVSPILAPQSDSCVMESVSPIVGAPSRVYSDADLFSDPSNLTSVSLDFLGFGSERSLSPDRERLSLVNTSSDHSPCSSQDSIHSFREQCIDGTGMSDAALAVRQLFPVPLSPPDVTFESDADLPSIESDSLDSDYSLGPVRRQSDIVPPDSAAAMPRRVTRSARTQVYPDLSPEEALRRIYFYDP